MAILCTVTGWVMAIEINYSNHPTQKYKPRSKGEVKKKLRYNCGKRKAAHNLQTRSTGS